MPKKTDKSDKVTKLVEILINTGNFESIRVSTQMERTVQYSSKEDLDQQKESLYEEVFETAHKDAVKTLEKIGREHAVSSITIKTMPKKSAPKDLFEDEPKDKKDSTEKESEDSDDDDIFANIPQKKPSTASKKKSLVDDILSDSKPSDKYTPDAGIEEPGDLDLMVQDIASSVKATINKKV